MKIYIVRGLNGVGEAEIEAAISANSPEEAEEVARKSDLLEIELMLEEGAIEDIKIAESMGPIHIISYPMQGI